MIDKHMYPKNYFFAVTKEGIDGRRSLLVDGNHRRRQSSVSNGSPKDARRRESLQGPEKQKPAPQRSQDGTAAAKPGSTVDRKSSTHQDGTAKTDRDMDDLTGAMSSLQFVPQSVRFGRGGRAGFSKK